MPTVTLKAHFDGAQIVLDEPCALPPNTALMVTVLQETNPSDISEDAWLRALATIDAFEFLADPREDIYSLADGEPIDDAV